MKTSSSNKPRLFYAILAASVFAMLALVALGLESSTGSARFASIGSAVSIRMTLYKTVAEASLDNPLFGTGFGAFRDAFTVYRTSDLGYGAYWNAAHNIYLEALFGLGIPVALVLFAGVAWVIWRVFQGAMTRRQHVTAPIAAATASAGLFTHGLFDFGLQTPAIAFIAAALLGVGCAQSWSSRNS